MTPTAILIPAAGFGTRMRGEDKLLHDVDGLPLIRRQALHALSAADHVIVTVQNHDTPRARALAGLAVHLVEVPDAVDGMAASIRRGVAALPARIGGVAILPCDMPDLTADDLARVLRAFREDPFGRLHQATTQDGRPGHPVIFPRDCFASLRQITGDRGARAILSANAHRVTLIPLPGDHALTDLDTPEAWAEWRAAQLATSDA